jgi:hypothetical protein
MKDYKRNLRNLHDSYTLGPKVSHFSLVVVYLQQNKKGRRPKGEKKCAKSGRGRLRQIKRGRGIKGRDDKSSIEILMSEVFVKINPTDPLIIISVYTKESKLTRFLRYFVCHYGV